MNSHSLLLILCCAGIIQSLFLAIYIFSTKRIQFEERLLLSGLLLAITIRLVKSVGWYFFDITDQIFLNIGFAAQGFIGPLLVIYFARKSSLLKKSIYHLMILAPAILILLLAPFLSLSNFWYVGGYQALLYYTIFSIALSGYYLWIIYIEKKIYFPWYRNLFLGISIFCISYFTNYIFALNPYITGPVIYALVIYLISFIMFSNHEIFTPLGDKKKYKNINLTPDQIAHHQERIERVMEVEQPYLQSDFNLTALSELTAIPKYLLSRFFSENMNKSFTDFTNSYRIEKAKRLLADPKFDNHKIAYIAYECGFNSLSSFNSAFRKNVDTSPSEYKKMVLSNLG
ncbi:helix-turn-helix transcriptional regulator [Ekhidna sp.]|uniref:helix-turn-helix transcriptional regulator n=1 Tax=Ekhidna sp. TaxID=2608089 RepID=UPI003515C4FB